MLPGKDPRKRLEPAAAENGPTPTVLLFRSVEEALSARSAKTAGDHANKVLATATATAPADLRSARQPDVRLSCILTNLRGYASPLGPDLALLLRVV